MPNILFKERSKNRIKISYAHIILRPISNNISSVYSSHP